MKDICCTGPHLTIQTPFFQSLELLFSFLVIFNKWRWRHQSNYLFYKNAHNSPPVRRASLSNFCVIEQFHSHNCSRSSCSWFRTKVNVVSNWLPSPFNLCLTPQQCFVRCDQFIVTWRSWITFFFLSMFFSFLSFLPCILNTNQSTNS